jgi:collagenase-like PrtC family protease
MIKQRKIELLAPAKNLECGIAAIDHGADAVYIGAPRFGARAAAGNSLEDIAALVQHAHLYNARIYVTVNTILRDEELKETEQMIWDLYRAGVDALIVQDMGLLELNLPPIPLHASTQMDNRTPQKVKFLAEAGFRQVVLARELSLMEISEIHSACPEVPLEVFVHGALCVSYSGQCYVSQACFGRSANRGECAQFCRLAFNMVDADGKLIMQNKHLLSLKDLNQSEDLEKLLDAGASSLKIEGRLKDVSYVKNVTAYYRQKLDAVFKRRKEYICASSGMVKLEFKPQLNKSFSRGSTNYFLYGRDALHTPLNPLSRGEVNSFASGKKPFVLTNSGVTSSPLERGRGVLENITCLHDTISTIDTPKSLGEEMGMVKEIRGNYLTVAGVKSFNNGDGVCYLDETGKLQGFRVNRVENNKLFPQEMPRIKPRTVLYRNFDQEFERLMSRKSAERKISIAITLAENNFGFTLTLTDEDDNSVSVILEREKELARTPQKENLCTQLGKLGNTPFEASGINIEFSDNWFIPASMLAELRRNGIEKLLEARRINYHQELYRLPETHHAFPVSELTYLGNVMNDDADSFYKNHGVQRIAPAYEKTPVEGAALMFCKHCLRYSMGWCPTHHKVRSPFKEPYYLVSSDGKRFRLEFDCKQCQMKVYAEK